MAAATDARSFLQRSAGIDIRSAILESGRTLTSERRARFHAVVQEEATDAYTKVRVAAAKALAMLADPTDLDLLIRLTESEPSRDVNKNSGVTVFPVRVEAARARARIRP